MTLTLDEVRQTRFHLARRNGYEPADVDTFVDKVEVAISQLSEENETLKKQVEALRNTEHEPIFTPQAATSTDSSAIEAELAAAKRAADEANRRLNELRASNDQLSAEVDSLRQQAAAASEGEHNLPVPVSTGAAAIAERIVVTTSADASPAVVRLVQLATEQAEQVVTEAQSEAVRKVDEATKKAHDTLTDARTRAERLDSEARVNAERIRSDARSAADQVTNEAQYRATRLDGETAQKRAELFAELEQERDVLLGRVDHLRTFEHSYRENLNGLLKNQLDALNGAQSEPSDVPALVSAPRPQNDSPTPRLDALLGSQRAEG